MRKFAIGGLAEARKGITTEAGEDMAKKKFQLDERKADIDKDGELSEYEKTRGEAVQKAMADEDDPEQDERYEMYHGGMMCGGDDMYDQMYDEVSGNPIPPGSSADNVRDDIEIMISEGEYVLPADVVKWHGLKHIMDMEAEAKMGLMGMYDTGLIQYVDEDYEEEPSGEDFEDAEVSDEDYTEQEEGEVIETPEGNEIEMVGGMTTTEEEMEPEDPEEEYPSENREYTVMKKPMVKFII